MAGLVPAIHVFLRRILKAWMPGNIRAFTPVFDGLRPGMTEIIRHRYSSPATSSESERTRDPDPRAAVVSGFRVRPPSRGARR
jgi:hypothetical protein